MVYNRSLRDRQYKNGPREVNYKQIPFTHMDSNKKMVVCRGCVTSRDTGDFPSVDVFNPDIYFTDLKGIKRSVFCYSCLEELYTRFKEKYGDQYKALYRLCSLIGVYYDDDLAHRVIVEERVYTDGSEVSKYIPMTTLYIRAAADNSKYQQNFMDSNDVPFEHIVRNQNELSWDEALSDQGKKDRNEIIEKFHSDPFDKEPSMDRARLYSDLLTLYDETMADDLVKQRAAIEVVKAFYRIDCIGRTIQELQKTPESMVSNSKVLKELIDQKKKETDMVTSFSKDHGFAERYQVAKSKGAGTLSSIVRNGFESHFDRLAVNRFDIETSNAMRQVADISAKSILNQIMIGNDDLRDMLEKQSSEISELQLKVAELREANRLLREKHIKEELMREYVHDLREKGITDQEIINAAISKISAPTYYSKNGDTK